MASQPDPIVKALTAIRGSGRFCTSGSRPVSLLGLRIEGEEALAFPLPKSQAEAIKRRAEPAPYGKGEATLRDPSVRKCWQIDAGSLEWVQPDWDELLAEIVDSVAGELGVEGTVIADPYKLLLYEKGGFFLPHRDTEKLDAMFGTLIVALPSEHEGGALVVRHGGEEEVVDFSSPEGSRRFQFAAFFADCEHEVRPVLSGHRLCLAFNLVLKRGKASQFERPVRLESALLVPHLKRLANGADSDLTAIVLDHQYTPANFRVAGLKRHDLPRANALFAAAAEAGFTARLALVTLHRSGQLEDEYDYGNRWDDVDPEDATMGEVYDESITIDAWRSPGDRVVKLGEFRVDPERVVAESPLGTGDPDEQESEGYTGNEGCTVDHWYVHAAVVFWPAADDERIRVRYAFEAACERLHAMAARKGAGTDKKFHKLARAALEETVRRIGPGNSGGDLYAVRRALPVLEAVSVAGWREAFDGLPADLLPNLLAMAGAKVWKAALATFGPDPAEAVFGKVPDDGWNEFRRTVFSALDALLAGDHAPAVAATLAGRLPESLAKPDQRRWGGDDDDDPETSTRVQRLHLALAASHLVTNPARRKCLRAAITGDYPLANAQTDLGLALVSRRHADRLTRRDSLYPEVLRSTIDLLEREVARPINPYPDWTRPFLEPRDTAAGYWRSGGGYYQGRDEEILDAELKTFLADSEAESHRFRHAQAKREHLKSVITRRDLDLECHTLKSGSPHSLVCTKTDKSYHSALAQRASDENLLAKLKSPAATRKSARKG